MMIETLISMARYLSAHKDDDFADRMNYLYTPNMLLAFSVLISFKQFGGSWEQYAENFCWSEDTYYLPPQVHVAQIKESERYSEERKLSYYQWVPFFLLLQAACFRLPSLLWKAASLSSGVRVHDIVVKALDSQNMEDECRHRTIIMLANHLARALQTDRYQWYGISVIQDLMRGIPWQASGYFPRVRQMANIQKYSVQCVLVINIFTEKIFILLWFWYGILLVATSISFIYW
uniref:Innexin n=1 Tax=Meloidogyne floridensis TaxID=298350 RepID=A0A915P6N7_9BILA